jgi:hypothetical protein
MRRWIPAVAAVVAVTIVAGLAWFEPWKLFTSTTVNDDVPVIAATASSGEPSPTVSSTPTQTTAVLLAEGTFVTHEHATSGTAQLIRTAGGGQQLILRDLDTSDGPDLRVWLTDQPVQPGSDGWRVFDDGSYVEVAPLKGNRGTQVYDIPAEVDVSEFRSVSIWCKRFSVSFGAAELA